MKKSNSFAALAITAAAATIALGASPNIPNYLKGITLVVALIEVFWGCWQSNLRGVRQFFLINGWVIMMAVIFILTSQMLPELSIFVDLQTSLDLSKVPGIGIFFFFFYFFSKEILHWLKKAPRQTDILDEEFARPDSP